MLMDFKFLTSFLLLRMPVNQVEQGEQVDPDNVDEVPVETVRMIAAHVNRCVDSIEFLNANASELDADSYSHCFPLGLDQATVREWLCGMNEPVPTRRSEGSACLGRRTAQRSLRQCVRARDRRLAFRAEAEREGR